MTNETLLLIGAAVVGLPGAINTIGSAVEKIVKAKKARLCQNHFDIPQNTVLGQARSVFDYETPAEAIAAFENLKIAPGMVWREDDRVLYSKDDYWNNKKRWKDGKKRYALMLDEKEALVLYDRDEGYRIRFCIGGRIEDDLIKADSIEEAKVAAELWIANKLVAEIQMHRRIIYDLRMKMEMLTKSET